MDNQKKIKSRLMSLNELEHEDVTVKVTGGLGKITISNNKKHVAKFIFKWVDGNHYVGYFATARVKKKDQSKKSIVKQRGAAIVSLWTSMDAIRFVALYATLVELRAKRDSNE
jgi:hypothetical protein